MTLFTFLRTNLLTYLLTYLLANSPRQMLALKKENARLKPAADKSARERALAGGLDSVSSMRPATAGAAGGSSGFAGQARLGSAPPGARRGASAADLAEADEPGSLATQER